MKKYVLIGIIMLFSTSVNAMLGPMKWKVVKTPELEYIQLDRYFGEGTSLLGMKLKDNTKENTPQLYFTLKIYNSCESDNFKPVVHKIQFANQSMIGTRLTVDGVVSCHSKALTMTILKEHTQALFDLLNYGGLVQVFWRQNDGKPMSVYQSNGLRTALSSVRVN